MKKILLVSLFAVVVSMSVNCTNNEKKTILEKETLVSSICYFSSYEGDSAKMELSYFDNSKVRGKLKITYKNGTANSGTVTGKFKGDTLFADYKFSTASAGSKSFSNPLALLKSEANLILGVGQIETTLGRSYFVKGKPINFERAKFTFAEAPCK